MILPALALVLLAWSAAAELPPGRESDAEMIQCQTCELAVLNAIRSVLG